MSETNTSVVQKPTHVACIMDGNRRAGEQEFGGRLEGHRHGLDTVHEVIKVTMQQGISYLTLYAFSTENWKRQEVEVELLMNLFREFLQSTVAKFVEQEIRFTVIGRRDRLSADIVALINEAEAQTKQFSKLTVQFAIDYGGRDELVRAIARLHGAEQPVTEAMVSEVLDTAGIPDPDLVIRTGGEQRLSGFLLWQSAYAELYFTDTYWPMFDEVAYMQALDWYSSRQRRHGR